MKFVGIVLLVDVNITLGIMYLFTIAALEKIVFIYPPPQSLGPTIYFTSLTIVTMLHICTILDVSYKIYNTNRL